MRFRKLRIVWSVVWGLAAVLLIVLWVRSRHWYDETYFSVAWQKVSLSSSFGAIGVAIYVGGADLIPSGIESSWFKDLNASGIESPWRFSCSRQPIGAAAQPFVYYLGVPHWFAVFGSVIVATLPWVGRRFSLRTLLIATTLIAVVLGLVVWLAR